MRGWRMLSRILDMVASRSRFLATSRPPPATQGWASTWGGVGRAHACVHGLGELAPPPTTPPHPPTLPPHRRTCSQLSRSDGSTTSSFLIRSLASELIASQTLSLKS